MKSSKPLPILWLLALAVFLFLPQTRADAVFSGCSQSNLVSALSSGGRVTYTQDCALTLTSTIQISNTVTLDATGFSASINGNNALRLFSVEAGGKLTLLGLTLSNGRVTNGSGSAIYINPGATVTLSNCVVISNSVFGSSGFSGFDGNDRTNHNGDSGENGAPGSAAYGGAIYNLGTIKAFNSVFATNSAIGGAGGSGGNGGSGSGTLSVGGDGGTGAAGGNAFGGAIYNRGVLIISNTTVSGNSAVGGNGGVGGSGGTAVYNGTDASGGTGASAFGGGIYSTQSIVAASCTFSDNSAKGGDSAAGGTSSSGDGSNGASGGKALGGGLNNSLNGSVTNCTFFRNLVSGGKGGDGGTATRTLGISGNGGNGGLASGGGVYNLGSISVVNATLSSGSAVGGTGGTNGPGVQAGNPGGKGGSRGGNLANGGGDFQILNDIITAASSGTNGNGAFTDLGNNISSDSSMPLTGTSRSKLDPKLGPLAANGGPTMTMAIATNSPAHNAGANVGAPSVDQRGVLRPTESVTDIGAYEISGPFIVIQPQDITVTNGQSATFTVTAVGTSLTYQWRYQGNNIANATTSSYTVANAQSTNRGLYGVRIGNYLGSVLSHSGLLTIRSSPSITNQTTNVVVTVGSNAVFSVSLIGDEPLSYQWNFNGTNLAGATSNPLVITNAQSTNAGNYFVVVTNVIGGVTSSVMNLRVLAPTPLSLSTGPSNALQLNLQAQTGFAYVVESNTNLTNSVWVPLSTNTSASNGPMVLKFSRTNAPSSFYRVRIQ